MQFNAVTNVGRLFRNFIYGYTRHMSVYDLIIDSTEATWYIKRGRGKYTFFHAERSNRTVRISTNMSSRFPNWRLQTTRQI